jgi:hypothetical protein
VLEPVGMDDEERLFQAYPEMIVARIFFHAPLQPGDALLIKNVKNVHAERMLRGTIYEEYAQNNSLENGAFALIKESSVSVRFVALKLNDIMIVFKFN